MSWSKKFPSMRAEECTQRSVSIRESAGLGTWFSDPIRMWLVGLEIISYPVTQYEYLTICEYPLQNRDLTVNLRAARC